MASTVAPSIYQHHQHQAVQQPGLAPGIHVHQPWNAQSASDQAPQAFGLAQQYTIPAHGSVHKQSQYGLVSELTEPSKQYGLLAEMSQPSDTLHGVSPADKQPLKQHDDPSIKTYHPVDGQQGLGPGGVQHGKQYGLLSELNAAYQQPELLAGNTQASYVQSGMLAAANQQSMPSSVQPGPTLLSASVPNLRDALNNSLANSRVRPRPRMGSASFANSRLLKSSKSLMMTSRTTQQPQDQISASLAALPPHLAEAALPPAAAPGTDPICGPYYAKPIPPNVLAVTVQKADVFRPDTMLTNPVVRVHILDPNTGDYVRNLMQPDINLDPGMQAHMLRYAGRPNLITLGNNDTSGKPHPALQEYLPPVQTAPYNLLHRLHPSALAVWGETMMVDEAVERLIALDVLLMFEILQLPVSFHRYAKHPEQFPAGAHRVAWAFLRFNKQKHAETGLMEGDENPTGSPQEQEPALGDLKLQLYRYRAEPLLGGSAAIHEAEEKLAGAPIRAFTSWKALCSKPTDAAIGTVGLVEKYPAALHVNIRASPRPFPEVVRVDPPANLRAVLPAGYGSGFEEGSISLLQFMVQNFCTGASGLGAAGLAAGAAMIEKSPFYRSRGEPCRLPNRRWKELATAGGGACCTAFSWDGSRVAVAVGEGQRSETFHIIIYSSLTGAELVRMHSCHQGWVYSLTWSKDDTALLSAASDGTAQIWEMSLYHAGTKTIRPRILRHPWSVYGALFHPMPSQHPVIFTACRNGGLYVWHRFSGQQLAAVLPAVTVQPTTTSPRQDSAVSPTARPVGDIKGAVHSLALDTLGTRLWAGDGYGTIQEFSVDTAGLAKAVQHLQDNGLAWSDNHTPQFTTQITNSQLVMELPPSRWGDQGQTNGVPDATGHTTVSINPSAQGTVPMPLAQQAALQAEFAAVANPYSSARTGAAQQQVQQSISPPSPIAAAVGNIDYASGTMPTNTQVHAQPPDQPQQGIPVQQLGNPSAATSATPTTFQQPSSIQSNAIQYPGPGGVLFNPEIHSVATQGYNHQQMPVAQDTVHNIPGAGLQWLPELRPDQAQRLDVQENNVVPANVRMSHQPTNSTQLLSDGGQGCWPAGMNPVQAPNLSQHNATAATCLPFNQGQQHIMQNMNAQQPLVVHPTPMHAIASMPTGNQGYIAQQAVAGANNQQMNSQHAVSGNTVLPAQGQYNPWLGGTQLTQNQARPVAEAAEYATMPMPQQPYQQAQFMHQPQQQGLPEYQPANVVQQPLHQCQHGHAGMMQQQQQHAGQQPQLDRHQQQQPPMQAAFVPMLNTIRQTPAQAVDTMSLTQTQTARTGALLRPMRSCSALAGEPIANITMHPGGRKLLILTQKNRLATLDTRAFRESRDLGKVRCRTTLVKPTCSPDGMFVIAGGEDGSVRAWDGTSVPAYDIPASMPLAHCELGVLHGGGANSIPGGAVAAPVEKRPVHCVAWNPSLHMVATCGWGSWSPLTLSVYDPECRMLQLECKDPSLLPNKRQVAMQPKRLTLPDALTPAMVHAILADMRKDARRRGLIPKPPVTNPNVLAATPAGHTLRTHGPADVRGALGEPYPHPDADQLMIRKESRRRTVHHEDFRSQPEQLPKQELPPRVMSPPPPTQPQVMQPVPQVASVNSPARKGVQQVVVAVPQAQPDSPVLVQLPRYAPGDLNRDGPDASKAAEWAAQRRHDLAVHDSKHGPAVSPQVYAPNLQNPASHGKGDQQAVPTRRTALHELPELQNQGFSAALPPQQHVPHPVMVGPGATVVVGPGATVIAHPGSNVIPATDPLKDYTPNVSQRDYQMQLNQKLPEPLPGKGEVVSSQTAAPSKYQPPKSTEQSGPAGFGLSAELAHGKEQAAYGLSAETAAGSASPSVAKGPVMQRTSTSPNMSQPNGTTDDMLAAFNMSTDKKSAVLPSTAAPAKQNSGAFVDLYPSADASICKPKSTQPSLVTSSDKQHVASMSHTDAVKSSGGAKPQQLTSPSDKDEYGLGSESASPVALNPKAIPIAAAMPGLTTKQTVENSAGQTTQQGGKAKPLAVVSESLGSPKTPVAAAVKKSESDDDW